MEIFSVKDISILTKELETSIPHLYQEEKTSKFTHFQNGG